MRTKAELPKAPDQTPPPGAPPPGIRITSGRTKDEIGRVHHADGVWTAFARDADGRYRTLGAHPDFAAALSAIPDAPAPVEREVPKAVAPKPRRQTAATAAPLVKAPAAAVQAGQAQSGKAQSGKPRAVRSRAA